MNASDEQITGESKAITLAETSSVSSVNQTAEFITVENQIKQKALLHQRAFSHNLLKTPPQGQSSTKNQEPYLKSIQEPQKLTSRHRKLKTMQLKVAEHQGK